ncbi:ATP-binding cassette domain-containing protein [Streptomyces sp. uw30]|uniref:ATP-binding cassette domain-containing protein n=1 Tax=Streptomyces sp. uw30 TaxID=1828179 RepID=UPI0021C6F167|nr:ATP-binding cassette domain-containing protein [Streptomyces sp. uw30]
MTGRLLSRGLRHLRARWRVLVPLGLWSVLETGQSFLIGYAPARALDDGFLQGRTAAGLGWLGVAGVGVVVGAYGTARVYAAVAALVEPLRDRLVRRVVERGVREADRGALSGLTQQVEIARDTFAGLVMVSRSFVFSAVGALAGLFSLAPLLLLVVLPPLVAGVGLFAATLRPLARRQETFLAADEALADRLGAICPGLRDITASGAEERTAVDVGHLVEAERRAARSLARFGVVRVAALALGGQLPIVLLLAAAPWLLHRGVTTGALVGALSYVTQSLLPALHNLVHGLGTSGSRLAVVLRRLAPESVADSVAGRRGGRPVSGMTTQRRRPRAGATQHDRQGRRRDTPDPQQAPGPIGDRSRPRSDPPCDRGVDPSAAGAPGPLPQHPHSPGPPTHRPCATAPPALALSRVTFAYSPTAVPVIDDLDLALPPGSHLAVVGPSGIGKSTLTALVAGLLEPRCGTIRVGGRAAVGPGSVARRVLIPQEAYVFTGSLAENLAHLRPDPLPEAELLAAAEAVGLLELLDALGGPEGHVDPAALSAGQRQLIALTRAYLSHARLALLDEATCHLDPAAEERAERAFAARPGATLVVVAHRITSASRADRVLMMDGRETAYGTHDELVRNSARYRELVGAWTPVPRERSEPSLALRDPDGVDAVAGPGLAGDGRHVVAHGPVGQVQAPRDLRDGRALGGEG